MSREPERVRVESGPSLASLNGRRLRSLDNAPDRASLSSATLDMMPSLKVSSSLAPLSNRLMPESHSAASAHALRIQSPTRNRSAKAIRESQKLSHTRWAMSVAVAQSPVNTAAHQRNRETRVSMPRTTFAMTVATASRPQLRTPPTISPRPRASLAAPLTSAPNTEPISSPTLLKRSPILRMAGVRAETAPSKFSLSQMPAKNSLMRNTMRPTLTTKSSSPAALISLASSPRISNVDPLRLSKMATTPLITRVMFRPQRRSVSPMPPKFFL